MIQRSTPVRPAGWVVIWAVLLTVLSGCSSLAPAADSAVAVAENFHRAVAVDDGPAACALMAPDTVAVVEQDSGRSCPEAVLGEDLPDGGRVVDRQAFGQLAQVVMTGDVVFLAAFGDQWRVTAVGCGHRDNRPYHCMIEGG
jgi:hypothetical protein